MMQVSVPRATLGRLPSYLQYLESLPQDGYISATTIAKALRLGEVQVRKDLNMVSGEGRPKVGYETAGLIAALETVLGRHDKYRAIIVGTGKLGRALLGYGGFARFGVEIVAAFDINPPKAEDLGLHIPIMHTDALKDYCQKENIQIGILTVPQASAQDTCDYLVESGITALWSFAPMHLKVPDNVSLREENLALSLAHLCTQILSQ